MISIRESVVTSIHLLGELLSLAATTSATSPMGKKKNYRKRILQQNVLKSVSLTRILLPIIIGTSVVGILFYRQYDQVSFERIVWGQHVLFWLLVGMLFLMGRILFYAARLKLLAEDQFSFGKCIQLIFIWEFSSTISPTNVGGSAVALFVISQEKIGAARTATIVIYTIVLDTLFFLLSVPVWVAIFGSHILGPGRSSFTGYGGWEITLLVAYSIMLIYGFLFSYGLFFRPQSFRRVAMWLSRRRWLRRYKAKFEQLGDNILLTSKALFTKDFPFHLRAFLYTVGAWSCRFFLVICLIIGFVNSVPLELGAITELYARIQTMFVMMAVSPTPGGAGLAELLFDNILSDYVPKSISLIVATIWRGMAYYFFLLAGAIIIPQWLNRIARERKQKKPVQAGVNDRTNMA